MKILGGDIVVRALEAEGVRYTFGIPGTHNTELYDSLENSQQITPILVTDEQCASFMADGVSRTSDQVGVVNVVPGAGLTHCLSGVAEAFMDNIPLVVLVCGIRTDTGNDYQLHQIDQLAIIRPIVKETFQPRRPEEIYPMVREAFRIARSGTPGPVAIEIAANYYFFPQEISSLSYDENQSLDVPEASSSELERAVELISNAKRPALYIGNGAAHASDLLVRVAEILSAPVATTIQGKGVFPEDHPLWLWSGFGNSAPSFVQKIMDPCDCLLAIGCRFSEVATCSYGINPPENLIHVDINADVFNKNYPAKLAIEADARKFLEGLIDRLKARPETAGLKESIAKGHEKFWQEARTAPSQDKVTPALFFEAVQKIAGPDAFYATDSGNGIFTAMEFLRLTRPGCFIGPVDYSCMGYSVPGAIGAKLVNPDRPVVTIAGDGALLMTGLELITATSYGIAPMVFVFTDGTLSQITQLQQALFNRDTCTVLFPYDLSAFAKTCGAEFLKLENDLFLEEGIRKALDISKTKKPVLIDVNIDYSKKTFFTKGVLKTYLLRLPWSERFRMISRIVRRRLFKA